MSTAVCPECAAGKCVNCDGTAWDHDTDQPTDCTHTHILPGPPPAEEPVRFPWEEPLPRQPEQP